MKAHYTGSVAFDNDKDEWQDELVMAHSVKELCEDMKELMSRRKNSEVFFAAYVDQDGKEKDITLKVREQCG